MTIEPDPADPTADDSPGPAAAIDLRTGRHDGDGWSPGPVADEPSSASRRRILDAATEVFREKGFTGTRVIDIARRAGFTSGALYSYFDSRADLLSEAIAEASFRMLGDMVRALEGRPGPADLVEAVLDGLTGPAGDDDQMLLDALALAGHEPVAGQRLAEALTRFREQVGPHGVGLDQAQADLLVVLVLGVLSARALGMRGGLGADLRQRVAACFGPSDEVGHDGA